VLRQPVESGLAAPVGVKDATGNVTAAGDSHLERGDHQAGFHAAVDGPADDPVRVRVFDSAAVELAFAGAVLGYVREPQLVRGVRGEVAAHQVVMGRGARLGPLAGARLAEHRPPAVVPADLPHRAVTRDMSLGTDLIGEEPIPELGIVAVRVEDRVRQVRLVELGVGDRAGQPPVVGLAGDHEDPARHRDGDPVGGELTDERVHHFPGRFAWDR
jgi:hypothetical protein